MVKNVTISYQILFCFKMALSLFQCSRHLKSICLFNETDDVADFLMCYQCAGLSRLTIYSINLILMRDQIRTKN